MLTRNQISIIHVAKAELGLQEEEYRSLLLRFNVKSSKDLSFNQFHKLMETFEKMGFKSKYLTKKQKTLIRKMTTELWGEYSFERLNKIIFDQIGMEITPSRLSVKEASKIISALNKIKKWRDEKNEK